VHTYKHTHTHHNTPTPTHTHTHDNTPTPTHTHTPRGLLTGKFQRGQPPPDPSSSRVAWVEADQQSRTNQSHPSLSQYGGNEQFWDLLDAMRRVAEAHSKRNVAGVVAIHTVRGEASVNYDHRVRGEASVNYDHTVRGEASANYDHTVRGEASVVCSPHTKRNVAVVVCNPHKERCSCCGS